MAMAQAHALAQNGGPRQRRGPPRVLEGLYAEAEHEKSEDDGAHQVLTSNIDETWNSARIATPESPVAINISLGPEPTFVDHIDLLPYQVPTSAVTHHKVYLDDQLVTEVRGETRHHKAMAPIPVGRVGRQLRIETVESPSWVAWSKVQVWGS